VLLLNTLFLVVFFKELKIVAFDPALATTLGINARLMHYLIMTVVAVTTVAAFESVGSILVIAMLIVPGATAYLLTERLRVMLVLSALLAGMCAVVGHVAAITVPGWWGFADTSTAGMMAAVGGTLFVVVLAGTMARRAWHRLALGLRIACEDVLGLLYRLEELHVATLDRRLLHQIIGNRWLAWLALTDLRRRRLIVADALTATGRAAGRTLIRSHRLWESYLAKHLGLPADHLHATSEKLEHITSPAMQARLDERADRPARDPHGRDIPRV
jgi:manganese/zinc/iron transport system permease protein